MLFYEKLVLKKIYLPIVDFVVSRNFKCNDFFGVKGWDHPKRQLNFTALFEILIIR